MMGRREPGGYLTRQAKTPRPSKPEIGSQTCNAGNVRIHPKRLLADPATFDNLDGCSCRNCQPSVLPSSPPAPGSSARSALSNPCVGRVVSAGTVSTKPY